MNERIESSPGGLFDLAERMIKALERIADAMEKDGSYLLTESGNNIVDTPARKH